jgi:hypothetical protein
MTQAKLADALRPFAEYSAINEGPMPDDRLQAVREPFNDEEVPAGIFTFGQCRHARRILALYDAQSDEPSEALVDGQPPFSGNTIINDGPGIRFGSEEPSASNTDDEWEVNVVESQFDPGIWIVEQINVSRKGDGDVYQTTFNGSGAETRAREYQAFLVRPTPTTDLDRAWRAVDALLVALEFYANRAGYDTSGPSRWFSLVEDSGAVARAAIEKLGGRDRQGRE